MLGMGDKKSPRGGSHAIETLIGRYRECLDVIVCKAWDLGMHRDAGLVLVATGGYGRGELYPHSDIDLLVCGDEAEHARHADAIGRFFSMLWDSGLKVGQAVGADWRFD